jgi:hypothetical protein
MASFLKAFPPTHCAHFYSPPYAPHALPISFVSILPPAQYSSFLTFLDHTQRRTTVGRTPLDEWSSRRRDLYLTTHNTHNRQTSMPPGGIRIHYLSRQAAADLRLRPRGHWDRQTHTLYRLIKILLCQDWYFFTYLYHWHTRTTYVTDVTRKDKST